MALHGTAKRTDGLRAAQRCEASALQCAVAPPAERVRSHRPTGVRAHVHVHAHVPMHPRVCCKRWTYTLEVPKRFRARKQAHTQSRGRYNRVDTKQATVDSEAIETSANAPGRPAAMAVWAGGVGRSWRGQGGTFETEGLDGGAVQKVKAEIGRYPFQTAWHIRAAQSPHSGRIHRIYGHADASRTLGEADE